MPTYAVGIVGESFYQRAISESAEGERVRILREHGNPHDADALAVENRYGDTIGYIARKSWLREAIIEQGNGCYARIKAIGQGEGQFLGVVLDVTLCDDEVFDRDYRPADKSEPRPMPPKQDKAVLAPIIASLARRLFK